jgi:8-oxo-dGTP pyrophosphatase MutT (NUDIX family)
MGHIHATKNDYDLCVEVFIVYQNTVLLRKHDKFHEWMSIGGHFEPTDHTPETAAHREVKEEVGLKIKIHETTPNRWQGTSPNDGRGAKVPHDLFIHYVPGTESHTHITLVYFATTDNPTVVPEKPTDEWKWCTREDILANNPEVADDVRHSALRALDLLGTKTTTTESATHERVGC